MASAHSSATHLPAATHSIGTSSCPNSHDSGSESPRLVKVGWIRREFSLDAQTVRKLIRKGLVQAYRTNGNGTGKWLIDRCSLLSHLGVSDNWKMDKSRSQERSIAVLVRKSNPDRESIQRQLEEVKKVVASHLEEGVISEKRTSGGVVDPMDKRVIEFVENGISGMNCDLRGARKELGRLWGLIAEGRISAVYVRTKDRIWRVPGAVSIFELHCRLNDCQLIETHPDSVGVDHDEIKEDIDILFSFFHVVSMKRISRRASRLKKRVVPEKTRAKLLEWRAAGESIWEIIKKGNELGLKLTNYDGSKTYPLTKQVVYQFFRRETRSSVSLEKNAVLTANESREAVIEDFLKRKVKVRKSFDKLKNSPTFDIYHAYSAFCNEKGVSATSWAKFGMILADHFRSQDVPVFRRKISMFKIGYPCSFYLVNEDENAPHQKCGGLDLIPSEKEKLAAAGGLHLDSIRQKNADKIAKIAKEKSGA